MKPLFIPLAFSFIGITSINAQASDFYAHWGDGRAEISSYKIVQDRYGEARPGHSVLIFVTEDIHRDTYIKVESPTPKEDRLYTLKLNNVLKFNTGIYDYSVMTSVFSVIGADDHPFTPKKVALSAQEWCGHVFEEVLFEEKKLKGTLNSYFEREGRQDYTLNAPEAIESEDHLLISIRELNGTLMQEGEQRTITLLPSLWYFRVKHQDRDLVQATLHKGRSTSHSIAATEHAAIPWTWKTAQIEKTV
jgi:hypothetical protein